MMPRASLTEMENLAVGAIGGTIETTVQMPFLTWKFSVQEGRPLPTSFAGWFRGVGIQAGMVAPITAIQVTANGMLEKTVLAGQIRSLTDTEKIACGASAGVISATVYSPVDLICIQQQKLGLSMADTVGHIAKTYGLHSLMRGFMSVCVREAIYTAGYLGLGPVFTDKYKEAFPELRENDLAAKLSGACTAGLIASLLTQPVDTAKTNVQADLPGKTWPTARMALPKLYRQYGLAGMYKGGVPRTMRTCGAFFIVSMLREKCIDYKTMQTQEIGEREWLI